MRRIHWSRTIPRPEGCLPECEAETESAMGEHGGMKELVVGLCVAVAGVLSAALGSLGHGVVRPKPCDTPFSQSASTADKELVTATVSFHVFMLPIPLPFNIPGYV